VGNLASMLEPLVELGREQGMRAVFEMSRSFFVGVLSGDEDRIAVLTARIEEKYDQLDVEAFNRLGHELSTYPSMVDRLGEITVPTTVLVGEGDTGLRASADQLAADIPGAELVVLPGGHSPQEDDPAAWQAAVRAHLNRLA
jgi:pimeloyl-ACP methyl ester carboxylesterase